MVGVVESVSMSGEGMRNYRKVSFQWSAVSENSFMLTHVIPYKWKSEHRGIVSLRVIDRFH